MRLEKSVHKFNKLVFLTGLLLCAAGGADAQRRHWVPEADGQLRGALIMQNGCGIINSNVWKEFARYWKFAIVGCGAPIVAPVAFYSSTYDSVDIVMRNIGIETGHPELEGGYLCTWGGSRGGWWAMEIAARHPSRTVATSAVISGIWPGNSGEARKIPRLFVLGEKDGSLNPYAKDIAETLVPQRQNGGLYSVALQWGLEHDYGSADQLLLPYFDQVLRFRLPKDSLRGDLNTYSSTDGWVGEISSWGDAAPKIAAADTFAGNIENTVWLPNRYTAWVWRAFMTRNPRVKMVSPGNSVVLSPTVTLSAELTEVTGAAIQKVQFYSGDLLLAEKSTVPYQSTVDLDPGLHSILAISVDENGGISSSKPIAVMVRGLGETWRVDSNGVTIISSSLEHVETNTCTEFTFNVSVLEKFRANATYVWNFGDSSSLDTTVVPQVTYKYKNEGIYVPRVKVIYNDYESIWLTSYTILSLEKCSTSSINQPAYGRAPKGRDLQRNGDLVSFVSYQGDQSISILDMRGRKYKDLNLKNRSKTTRVDITIPVASRVYLLQINSDTGGKEIFRLFAHR